MRLNQPGWKEYIGIRDAQKAAKHEDTTELQKKHGAERAALTVKLKAERDDALSGNWKGKGDQRNALQSILATQQAAAKLELSARHRDERQVLRDQYKALPMYKQWKEQPLIIGEAVRPLIDQHSTRNQQPTALVKMLLALSHTIDKQHHITYQYAGKDIFRDEGRILAVLDINSDRAIAAALATAQQKFGNTLTLTGSMSFQHNAVAVAVANNLTCKFADPALDALRARLQAEKYQAERTAARAAAVRVAELESAVARQKEKDSLAVDVPDAVVPMLHQQAQRAAEPAAEVSPLTEQDRILETRIEAAIEAGDLAAIEKCLNELGTPKRQSSQAAQEGKNEAERDPHIKRYDALDTLSEQSKKALEISKDQTRKELDRD